MKKRLVCLPILAMMASVLPACSSSTIGKTVGKTYDEEAAVIFTNDVHCGIEKVVKDGSITQMGYAAVASYKKELQTELGRENVLLVDNGDHLQGGFYGTLSLGEDIVRCMNAAGYDLAIPGNHEFDYGMDKFLNYANNLAEYQYISTNFVHEGKTVFNPYRIVELAGRRVAFLGATTPDTYTSSTPKYFKDENGNFVYTFSEGTERDGESLYKTIQKTVDKVRTKEKADVVVLMSHLGIDDVNSPYMSTDVIKNTTGIDVVLDGHSHSVIVRDKVQNKKGEDVLLSSTGTKLAYMGRLKLRKDGTISTELVHEYSGNKNIVGSMVIERIITDGDNLTKEVAATTPFDLTINDPDSGKRRVRKGETNLGDLIADGFQLVENSDFAFVNGGGVRNPVTPGNITLKNIMNFQPFGNKYETYETKGQNILDFLEYSASKLAKTSTPGLDWNANDEFGGYMQNSKGIKYSIDTTIDTPVVMDETGKLFKNVDSSKPRRVHSVQVATEYNADGSVKTWANFDANKTYRFASTSYYVENQGDGYTMLTTENTKKVTACADAGVAVGSCWRLPVQDAGRP